MPDYQRFITYINLYQQDEKLRNVGFAKIERRKEQCRFEIHMKNIGYTGQNSQIYFYVRRDQELECIPVGNVQLINGIADRRIMLAGDNIGGSGRALEEIAGLVIFINAQVMLASQWKEGEMRRGMFRLPGQEPVALSSNQTEETQPPSESVLSDPSGSEGGVPSSPAAMGQPAVQPSAPPAASSPSDAPSSVLPTAPIQQESQPPSPSAAQPQEPVASLHVAEASAVSAVSRPWSATWQMMLETYPVLMPFEGEEEILCIRIELKELRLLPRRYWYLGNNSFLLHGFFNYRYLILGQMEVQGMKRWFLGVPGVFQNQEKVMAAIFGFPEFKAEKTAKQKTNQFGYWYRFMDESD